jgi:hypothetical protein
MIRSELRLFARWLEARERSASRARATISLSCEYMVELLANKGFEDHVFDGHDFGQTRKVVGRVV